MRSIVRTLAPLLYLLLLVSPQSWPQQAGNTEASAEQAEDVIETRDAAAESANMRELLAAKEGRRTRSPSTSCSPRAPSAPAERSPPRGS